MLTQTGLITALPPVDTNARAQAVVSVLPASACERCALGQGCGAGLFSRLLRIKATELRLTLPHDATARVGQRVWLGLDEQQLARQAWFWYGLPVIGFVLVTALITWWWSVSAASAGQPADTSGWRDLAALLAGLLTMAGCWALTRRYLPPVMPRLLLNSPCADSS